MDRLRPYTREWISELCAESSSFAEVTQKAGRKGGCSQQILKKKILEWGIDVSHFKGHAWNKGLTRNEDERILGHEAYTFDEVFRKNSPVTQKMLRGYVQRNGVIQYQCSRCSCDGNWQGGIIKLELDHIDGDNKNNEISNLRYLCPNCHALTDTYRGKNIKR